MNQITEALKAKGWSQGELMRQLAGRGHFVSRSTVSNWCRGKRRPIEAVAAAIGHLLGIEVEPGPPGRAPKCHEVYLVTSQRRGVQRSVRVRALSSAVLARGMESGNRGDVAPILVRGLKDEGRLAPWAVQAHSSAAEDIAHAFLEARRRLLEMEG